MFDYPLQNTIIHIVYHSIVYDTSFYYIMQLALYNVTWDVCMYVCMYVCIYIYIYVYTHIYTYIQIICIYVYIHIGTLGCELLGGGP